MAGADETDPDFNTKLKLANFCFDSYVNTEQASNCFAQMNAPHLDLEVFTMGQGYINGAFTQTIANTITLTAQGYYDSESIDKIDFDDIHDKVAPFI